MGPESEVFLYRMLASSYLSFEAFDYSQSQRIFNRYTIWLWIYGRLRLK